MVVKAACQSSRFGAVQQGPPLQRNEIDVAAVEIHARVSGDERHGNISITQLPDKDLDEMGRTAESFAEVVKKNDPFRQARIHG